MQSDALGGAPVFQPTRDVPEVLLFRNLFGTQFCFTNGLQPKSCGLMYRIPALDTVAGVAVRKLEISNKSLIEGVTAIRSLLANVKI